MAYFPTEWRMETGESNPVVFLLRPEAQWKPEAPRRVEDLLSENLLLERLDLLVSTSLQDRWAYIFSSSLAPSDLMRLNNFNLLFSGMEITQAQTKTQRAIPDWILGWAMEFKKDGLTVEEAIQEARRISRKFKTPLSAEIIADREERR